MEQVIDSLPDPQHETILEDYLAQLSASNPCLQRLGLSSAILACARHALLRSLLQNVFLKQELLPQLVRDYVNIGDDEPNGKMEAKNRLSQVRSSATRTRRAHVH